MYNNLRYIAYQHLLTLHIALHGLTKSLILCLFLTGGFGLALFSEYRNGMVFAQVLT